MKCLWHITVHLLSAASFVVAAPAPVNPSGAPNNPWAITVRPVQVQPPAAPVQLQSPTAPLAPVAPGLTPNYVGPVFFPDRTLPPPFNPGLNPPPPIEPAPLLRTLPQTTAVSASHPMPPDDIPVEKTENKWTYRMVTNAYNNVFAENCGWHSVWGTVVDKPSAGGLLVDGFYAEKCVTSAKFLKAGKFGPPIFGVFLLTNCPDSYAANENLKWIYRAKCLGTLNVTNRNGSNYTANIFDYGKDKALPTSSRSVSKL